MQIETTEIYDIRMTIIKNHEITNVGEDRERPWVTTDWRRHNGKQYGGFSKI